MNKPSFRWVETLIVAIAVALVLREFVVQGFVIPSPSMEDTLLVGDFLLAEKITFRFRTPERGEVIIFTYPPKPDRDLIKRCVALEGDTIVVIHKRLYVNGKPVADMPGTKYGDPNEYPAFRSPRDNYGPYIVPAGCVFAMGDNRDFSDDSRFWGPVPLSKIKARPLFVYFSWRVETDKYRFRPPTVWNFIWDLIKTLPQIFSRLRWQRIGLLIK